MQCKRYVREWYIKNLYQINAKLLKIKSQKILHIINSTKIVLIIHLHQAHNT